jgi:hypothetical protein
MKYEIKKITYVTPINIGGEIISQYVLIKVGIIGDTYDFTKDVVYTVENIPSNYTMDEIVTYVTTACEQHIDTLFPDTD